MTDYVIVDQCPAGIEETEFEKILAEVNPARDFSRTPIFQVLLNMHSFDDQNLPLPELSVTRVHSTEINSLYDMTLYFVESTDEAQLSLVYNADLFTAGRMTEFMWQFQSILEQMISDPDRPLEAFTLVTPSARLYLPDPQQPLDAKWEGPVWSRLEHHAHQQGEAIAMVSPGETWTYQELGFRSNQLANFLLENSVQPGDVVAIYAHRSASLVWALVGIFKAGAAFVLLDPAYPTQRLIDILQSAKPKAWLQIEAAGELAEELTDNVEAQVANCHLVLPGLASAVELGLLADYSDKDPEIVVGPDDLAYVAFTSGTTGEPKGIVGTHGPLSHFLNWHIEKFSFNESDRFSMLSGLSHDPLLRDIFAPLWAGATLCIPEPGEIFMLYVNIQVNNAGFSVTGTTQ